MSHVLASWDISGQSGKNFPPINHDFPIMNCSSTHQSTLIASIRPLVLRTSVPILSTCPMAVSTNEISATRPHPLPYGHFNAGIAGSIANGHDSAVKVQSLGIPSPSCLSSSSQVDSPLPYRRFCRTSKKNSPSATAL